MSMRDRFDLTPRQYHGGLDKLWEALGITSVQGEDVFTLAARAIKDAKTLKTFRIRVYSEYMRGTDRKVDIYGPHRDHEIMAYNAEDAKQMAYANDLRYHGQEVTLAHHAWSERWTEILPEPEDRIHRIPEPTLKTFRIRVHALSGRGYKDFIIRAYDETDARMIAYALNGGELGVTEKKTTTRAKINTEVLPSEKPSPMPKEEKLTAVDFATLITSEFQLARLLRCHRKYGQLKNVYLIPCHCGRFTVDEWYPHPLGGHWERKAAEFESLDEARTFYLNVFDKLVEFDYRDNRDATEDSNFVIKYPSVCREHQV